MSFGVIRSRGCTWSLTWDSATMERRRLPTRMGLKSAVCTFTFDKYNLFKEVETKAHYLCIIRKKKLPSASSRRLHGLCIPNPTWNLQSPSPHWNDDPIMRGFKTFQGLGGGSELVILICEFKKCEFFRMGGGPLRPSSRSVHAYHMTPKTLHFFTNIK